MKTIQLPPLRSIVRVLNPSKLLNPAKMSPRRAVIVAVIISLLVHLAIFTALVIAYSDASKLNFARDRMKAREIELQVVPPDEPPPPFTIVPTQEHLFLDSRGLDIAKDPAEHPLFESDENMRAASEDPATGNIPLPSQEGKDREFNGFTTQRSLLGPTAKPFTPVEPLPPTPTSAPPPADVSLEPPAPATPEKADEKSPTEKPDDKPPTPNHEQTKPTDFKPVDKVLDDEISLSKKETHAKAVTQIQPPPDTPSPVAHAARLRPMEEPVAKLTTPVPKVPPQPSRQSGYQPEQEQNRIQGSISNRGKKSVDAIGTPMGRYRKQVNDAIGSRWYYYIHDRMDLLAFGSVQISFLIDAQGHVSKVKVESNTSNGSLADVSISAIRDAEIQPPPLDPASPMSQEPLEWSLTFTYYPFAK